MTDDETERDYPKASMTTTTFEPGLAGDRPVVFGEGFGIPIVEGGAPGSFTEDYTGPDLPHCQGCGSYVQEVHRFQALILSAANGGCFCEGHRQVTGDLPTEESALAVWTEVKTRPALAAKAAAVSPSCPNCGNASPEHERGLLYCGACGHTWSGSREQHD